MASGTCRCQLNEGMPMELHRSWLCYILLGICSERLLAAASMQKSCVCRTWVGAPAASSGPARTGLHVFSGMANDNCLPARNKTIECLESPLS
jgi:hypothetical protein